MVIKLYYHLYEVNKVYTEIMNKSAHKMKKVFQVIDSNFNINN